jgi:hypothetical protein
MLLLARRLPRFVQIACALWLGLIVVGFTALARHSAAACPPARASERWPVEAPIERAPHQPTLVLFLHPLCPCSHATLVELEQLLQRWESGLMLELIFTTDPQAGGEWMENEMFREASRIPGARLTIDRGGRIAALFGARTSGQVLLYAADGRRLFAGGITLARGHVGDNQGLDALDACLRGAPGAPSEAPVYGCGLVLPVPAGGPGT